MEERREWGVIGVKINQAGEREEMWRGKTNGSTIEGETEKWSEGRGSVERWRVKWKF